MRHSAQKQKWQETEEKGSQLTDSQGYSPHPVRRLRRVQRLLLNEQIQPLQGLPKGAEQN